MGGRIDDIAVSESDPSIIYLGYAVGGVFKSENNGTTFEPVFDEHDDGLDRRHRHPSDKPGHRLRRHRRAEQPADLVVRRRHLQDRPTAARPSEHRPPRDADDRAHRHRSEESGDRVRRVARTPVRTEQGARRLQDDRRRQDLDQGQVHRRGHRLHRHRHRPGQHATSSMRRAISGGAWAAASTAAAPAARCGRPRTPARRWTKLTGGPAAGHLRAHRARRLALEPERRLRADRSRSDRAAADDRGQRSGRGNREHAGRRRGGAGSACHDHAIRRGCRSWRTRRRGSLARRRRLRLRAAPGVVVAASPTTGATTPGPGGGFGRGTQQAAGTTPVPPAARSRPRRHLPLRQQGRDLDARQQLQRAADVLQPAARRSDQRQDDLRRRPAGREVARRRQDVRDARRRRRPQLARSRRPARDLDRPEEPEAPDDRQRRRAQRQLGPGQDVGLRQHDGDRARPTGSAPTCAVRTTSTSACRTTAAGAGRARRAAANGILNSDWFGIGGGDGFQTAVDPTDYNIVYTESQDGNTNRYDLRNGRVQSIRPRAGGPRPRWPWWCRRRRRRRRGVARRTCSTPVRASSTASTGTRRSSSRRTTRASSGSAATGCSSRTTAATRGWRAPISPSRSIATPSRSWACRATGRCSRRTTASSPTARSSRSRSRRSCRASCGPAPTTATCR